MKIKKEVEYQVSLKAILRDDGELSLSLSVAAPYGNRTATATVDTFSDVTLKKVKAVMKEVLQEEVSRVVGLAEHAAAQSMIAAVNMGEEI